ncbi:glycoside hydrolase family 2 TIM barrel-domain containing protein [Algibacter sp. R77976]|uniref:glycoside hydrolase family 2 TIM barrel-domain containing protein n=1 Tax=Algibacter sp. R77976 TaxID=3093873 RepID=UPI0037C72EB8
MPKFLIILLVICLSCKNDKSTTPVADSDRHIYLNNKPYLIKGICYHPVPKGSNTRDFITLTQDLALMKEAGINTIRVYAPIDDKAVLDEIDAAGIKVIMGFGYSDSRDIYNIASGNYLNYINTYKSHKAILMWELGNEYNYHPDWFEGDITNWYTALNTAANLIHQNDKTRLVASAHGELPDVLALSSCPNIDVWGMNVYRWDNPEDIFSQWKALSEKPMYISESGGDSYMTITKAGFEKGENQNAQAQANSKILDKIFENQNICSGVTMFSFTDGWWKAGNPDKQDIGGWAPNSTGIPYDGSPNEEFWGMVDIDRNKKETFDIIKNKYTKIKS